MRYYASIYQDILEWLGYPIILLYFSDDQYMIFNLPYQAKNYLITYYWSNQSPYFQELYWHRLKRDKKFRGIQMISQTLPANAKYLYFSTMSDSSYPLIEIYPDFTTAWKKFRSQTGFQTRNFYQQVKMSILQNHRGGSPHYLYYHSNDYFSYSLICVKLNSLFGFHGFR